MHLIKFYLKKLEIRIRIMICDIKLWYYRTQIKHLEQA